MPIIILLVAYALFGLLAALIGIRVGREMLKNPVQVFPVTINQPSQNLPHNRGKEFNYSITWLFINIDLIICSFILLNRIPWFIWSLSITGIVIIWSVRYKRALRQLSKPKFWIFFVFITLVTAFVFTKAQSGENSLMKGLLTGIQMNFRAAMIIVGFAVLGTELFNPVVRNFFLKTSFKNLPLALELSAESLPLFIANIPEFKSLIRNPVSIFYQVISHADRRLAEIKGRDIPGMKVFIITGSLEEGKTTYTKKLIDILRKNKIKVGGIIAERVMTDSMTTGYDIVNIETGKREEFLRENTEGGAGSIGKFTINANGLAKGKKILKSVINHNQTLVIINKIHILKLQNNN